MSGTITKLSILASVGFALSLACYPLAEASAEQSKKSTTSTGSTVKGKHIPEAVLTTRSGKPQGGKAPIKPPIQGDSIKGESVDAVHK